MVRVNRDLGFMLFVEGTNLFADGKDPAELYGRVNVALGELEKWFRCNMLTLYLKKTVCVFLRGARGTTGGPHYKEKESGMAEGVRFLRVQVDRDLNWVDHIQGMTVKVRQLLGIMRKASGGVKRGSVGNLAVYIDR